MTSVLQKQGCCQLFFRVLKACEPSDCLRERMVFFKRYVQALQILRPVAFGGTDVAVPGHVLRLT